MAVALAAVSWTAAAPAQAAQVRVAAVDVDDQFVHALGAALATWDAVVMPVHLGRPDANVPLPLDVARFIAQSSPADVVLWISGDGKRFAVRAYDAQSGLTTLLDLEAPPPYGAKDSERVALLVRSMLRFTQVAPASERLIPPHEEPSWAFGLTASLAEHFATNGPEGEARTSLYGCYFPPFLGHRVGAMLGVSIGSGLRLLEVNEPVTVNGTLTDVSVRGALAARFPLSPWATLEPSIGFAYHSLSISYSVDPSSDQGKSPLAHATPAFDPQVALSLNLPGGFARIGPWAGVTLLWIVHEFEVNQVQIAEDPRFTMEGGVRAEIVLP